MTGLLSTPKMPKIEEPKPLPDMDDPMIKKARRRTIAKETATSGAQSTILSTGGRETLGG